VTYDTGHWSEQSGFEIETGNDSNVAIIVAHKDDVLQIKNAALRYRPPDATPV